MILERILDTADSSHLGLEFDLAWGVKAGVDPMMLLNKYAGGCPRVHLRDLVETDSGLFEEDVGYAILDWDTYLPAGHAFCRRGIHRGRA